MIVTSGYYISIQKLVTWSLKDKHTRQGPSNEMMVKLALWEMQDLVF